MRLRTRILSLLVCSFLIFSNVNAITAKAAPLTASDSTKIANAISVTTHRSRSYSPGYAASVSNGNSLFINSFSIINLDAPRHGTLLDSTATVLADNGVSWDIPVLWVDKNGTLIKIAIEIGGVYNCYPILVFYMPKAYTLMFGPNATYDIAMPDFVNNMITTTGVTTLSNPSTGITYITPLIPGKTEFVAVTPVGYYTDTASTSTAGTQEAQLVNDVPSGPAPGPAPGPSPTPSSDYQYKYYNLSPDLTDDQILDISNIFSDSNTISKLGAENVAWLASFIQEKLEPEAVNLLLSNFPAYNSAQENNLLGEEIGLYIYYNDYYDGDNVSDHSGNIADVSWKGQDGVFKYRIGVNAAQLYNLDEDTNTYSFGGDSAYCVLDYTMAHEMMHAFMYDYNRTGMGGIQYSTATDSYTYMDGYNTVSYPDWFVEGIATAIGNPYQHWNSYFHQNYGYNSSTNTYSESALASAFTEYYSMQLNFSKEYMEDTSIDNRKSSYISGYLANVYLGNLAAKTYEGSSALIEYEDSDNYYVSAELIKTGINHILEKLHNGMTLDEIIAEISADEEGNSLYADTQDFMNSFIITTNDATGDDGASLSFCIKFLNYLESNSSDDETARGSIIGEFGSTKKNLLDQTYLVKKPKIYTITDTSDFTTSTVEYQTALQSGGTSVVGIITNSSNSGATFGLGIAAGSEEDLEGIEMATDPIYMAYVSIYGDKELSEEEADIKEPAKASENADNAETYDQEAGEIKDSQDGEASDSIDSDSADSDGKKDADTDSKNDADTDSGDDASVKDDSQQDAETDENAADNADPEAQNDTDENGNLQNSKGQNPEAEDSPDGDQNAEAGENADAILEDGTIPNSDADGAADVQNADAGAPEDIAPILTNRIIVSDPADVPSDEPESDDSSQQVLDAIQEEPSSDDDDSSGESEPAPEPEPSGE